MPPLRLAGFLLPFCIVVSVAAAPAPHKAPAHTAATPAPKKLGDFDDWTAATYEQGGHTVCYAFTRAQKAGTAAAPGQGILTVTERPGARDSVAIEAGAAFPANAAVKVEVEQSSLEFYTAQRNAFARDSKAAVAAFERGARAVAHLPGPHDKELTETFSLKGFSAAHAAILKACPAR